MMTSNQRQTNFPHLGMTTVVVVLQIVTMLTDDAYADYCFQPKMQNSTVLNLDCSSCTRPPDLCDLLPCPPNSTNCDCQPTIPATNMSRLDLFFTDIQTNRLTVQWTPSTETFSSYQVMYIPQGSIPSPSNFNSNTKELELTGLISGRLYTIAINAFTDQGVLDGQMKSQRTLPSPPLSLIIGSYTNTSIPISWTQPSVGDYDGYSIYYSPADGASSAVTNVCPSVTSYSLSGLTPSREYFISVVTVSANMRSTSVSQTQITKPSAVHIMNVVEITFDSIFVTWETPDGDHDGFDVSYGQLGETPAVERYELDDARELLMSGLVSGTSYQIVIVTTSGDEQSDAATWNITTSSITGFIQCPEGEVLSFNVPPDSDTAQIDVDIDAVDGNGNTINHDIIGGNIDIPGTLQFSETSKNGIVVNVRAVDDNHEIWCQFTVKVLDPHPPIITFCPSDQSQTTSDNSVLAEWDDAVATDNTELLSVTTNRVSRSDFPVGTSTVTVTAIDTSGNTATCTFDIVIVHGLEHCPDLHLPQYGALSCGATETAFQCVLNCKERYQPFRGRDVYTCISKIWNPTQPPRCVRLAPGHDVELVAEFTYPGVCASLTDMQEIIDNLHARIDDHDLCIHGENRVCNENSFTFTCGEDSKRRKRQADDLVVTVEVKLSNTANNSELDESFFDILDTMQKDLNEMMNSIEYLVKNGSFSLEINNQTILCDPNSFRIGEPVWTCFKGYISTSAGCVACPVGSYYDPSINDCIFCSVNEFQTEEAQLECEQCKDGKYTKGIGSFRESHCLSFISPKYNHVLVIVVTVVIVLLVIVSAVVLVIVVFQLKRKTQNIKDQVAYSCRNEGNYEEIDEGKLKRDNTNKLGKAMYDGDVEDIMLTQF
ncbi:uncharacterized protein LOC144437498 [Glandiceps talaboti]